MADNIIDPKYRVISHSWNGENEMLSRKKEKKKKKAQTQSIYMGVQYITDICGINWGNFHEG